MSKRPVTSEDIGKQVVFDHETYILKALDTRGVARIARAGWGFTTLSDAVFVVDPSDKDCTRCKVYASEFVEGEYGCHYCPTNVDRWKARISAYQELVETLEKRLEEAEKNRDPREGWTSCNAEVARAKYAEGYSVKQELWTGYLFKGKSYLLSNRELEDIRSTADRAWILSSASCIQTKTWLYKAPPK